MPLITIPTRIIKTSKQHTNKFVEDSISGNLTVDISDHMPQFCIIPTHHNDNPKQKRVRFKRDFKLFDPEAVEQELNQAQINININMADYTEEFNKQLIHILNKHVPIRAMNNHG